MQGWITSSNRCRQDELVALENFKDLGETFYQVPSWLHGQLREYELREKDDEVAKMLEENALTYQRSAAEVSAATVGLGRDSSNGRPLLRTEGGEGGCGCGQGTPPRLHTPW